MFARIHWIVSPCHWEMTVPEQPQHPKQQTQSPKETGADRLSRFIVAIVTCLGALGLVALLYFPLHYLK